MAPSNAKSGHNVDPTLRPDSRLAFRRQVGQTHGTHGTQGIIFADEHARLQAFDDTSMAVPPYPGFFEPKKAYRNVTQCQGKEIRTLGRVFWGFSP